MNLYNLIVKVVKKEGVAQRAKEDGAYRTYICN